VLEQEPMRVGGTAPAPALAGATIRVDTVSVTTPERLRHAPAALSFEARPGAVTVLVGPNGDGKSTALLTLMGLLAPDSGSVGAVLADGTQVSLDTVDAESWSRQCAWLPQRPDLGVAGATISLGQRERAALARALDSDRPVVVLDEPTAHLDSASRAQVVAAIRAAASAGRTVVVATHERELVKVADAVVTVLGERMVGP
jgi:ATP-binding cassette subfamily C protein CydD